jgi:hypothetical protein
VLYPAAVSKAEAVVAEILIDVAEHQLDRRGDVYKRWDFR